MKSLHKCSLLLLTMIALPACQFLDTHAKNWGLLRTGDSREQVIHLLGEPTKVIGLELSMASVEQCSWKVPGGRTYVAHFAMNRLIAKFTFD